MSTPSRTEKHVAGGTRAPDLEEAHLTALKNNTAMDTPFDLRILGEVARLHGGDLPVAAPISKNVSVHHTSGSDSWIQLAVQQENGMSLDDVAFAAYQELFSQIAQQKGQLVRIWNQIPQILSQENGIVRYHRFNAGRLRAWEQFGPKAENGQLVLPAATGIGTAETFLFIRALCSQNPTIMLQNPLQIPPNEYSAKYGALPPLFSRATILLRPDRHQMFVSGTASIIGEDTRHAGDPALQAKETLNNLHSLISSANCRQHGYDSGFTFDALKSMRVYVKFADHFDDIRAVVEKQALCPTIYKLCDICRQGLLVEIECIFERRLG